MTLPDLVTFDKILSQIQLTLGLIWLNFSYIWLKIWLKVTNNLVKAYFIWHLVKND